MGKSLYDDCYIVMSEYGIQRMTKRQGQLKRGEIGIKVRISVPESCFAEPDVSVVVNVPESAIVHPKVEVEALPADAMIAEREERDGKD